MAKYEANPLIFFLICIFGSSAWLGSYSLTVEMSVFTQKLPERWALGSVITVSIQAAIIGPLIYMFLDRCLGVEIPRGKFIQIALFICTLCNVPLALFWEKTIPLVGKEHSITLIVMAFVIGMINVSSEVVFMPYMIKFKSVYLPAYFVGAGLSSMVPSFVAMAQGSLNYKCSFDNSTQKLEPQFEEPRFGVSTFYLIIFMWMCLASFSFYLINNHSDWLENLFKSQSVEKDSDEIVKRRESFCKNENDEFSENELNNLNSERKRSKYYDLFLLMCLGLIACEMYTLIPNLQSYVALPYSQDVYFYSLILSSIAQPLGALISFFIKPTSTFWLITLSVICFLCSTLFLVIASQSPNPLLKGSWWGGFLVIILEILIFVLGFLLRTALVESYRDNGSNEKEKEFRLFIGGLVTQAFVVVSTVLFFLLINVFQVFKDAPMCS